MFYVAWFIFAWIVWLRFADKTRWREILPVCIFAKALALGTDVLMFYYPLWEYLGPPYLIHLADDLAIYPVVTYLFIQWQPGSRTVKDRLSYWMIWTTVAIAVELIYVHFGYMRYHLWWSTWHSYAADWFLYWLFFKFHRILRLEKLSAK
ncbi:MAG: hypothetical protein P4N41_12260 [Negativicutes bacterium]|nr:hypothetical protein [Negativicutes bacterium]